MLYVWIYHNVHEIGVFCRHTALGPMMVSADIKEIIIWIFDSLNAAGATASLRGGPKFALLACSKFALRALAQCMAREHQAKVPLLLHFSWELLQ